MSTKRFFLFDVHEKVHGKKSSMGNDKSATLAIERKRKRLCKMVAHATTTKEEKRKILLLLR